MYVHIIQLLAIKKVKITQETCWKAKSKKQKTFIFKKDCHNVPQSVTMCVKASQGVVNAPQCAPKRQHVRQSTTVGTRSSQCAPKRHNVSQITAMCVKALQCVFNAPQRHILLQSATLNSKASHCAPKRHSVRQSVTMRVTMCVKSSKCEMCVSVTMCVKCHNVRQSIGDNLVGSAHLPARR